MRGNITDPTAAKPPCSAPEYTRSSVDLTYRSDGTTGIPRKIPDDTDKSFRATREVACHQKQETWFD